ncbi:photosystem II reaction center protein PsbW [Kitasatospora sp. NPDC059571]|uniref:photosystem II reaction center protein PsbW n=1 Tax=Kitasatospora sp. NPDC059571 TaxID=3346871 RepID=UPI00367F38F8
MDKRNAMRAGAVTAAATLMMLMTSPAMALTQDDGEQAGTGLSLGQTLGLYVFLPIAIFLLITGLVMLGTRGQCN